MDASLFYGSEMGGGEETVKRTFNLAVPPRIFP